MATFNENQLMADWLLERIDRSLQDERRERSDHRLHATELIYCLRKAWRNRHLDELGYTRGESAPNATLLTGHAFDQLAARADNGDGTYQAHYRLGTPLWTGEADGLIRISDTAYTPDSDAINLAVIDFKTTAYGPAKIIPLQSPHYVDQVATYLVSEYIKTGELHTRAFLAVMHLNPRTIKVWDITFTDSELLDYADELERRAYIVLGDDEPGTDEMAPREGKMSTSWECKFCPFFVKNGGDCEGGPGRERTFFSLENVGEARLPSKGAEVRD